MIACSAVFKDQDEKTERKRPNQIEIIGGISTIRKGAKARVRIFPPGIAPPEELFRPPEPLEHRLNCEENPVNSQHPEKCSKSPIVVHAWIFTRSSQHTFPAARQPVSP